jgi:hypothetical protein
MVEIETISIVIAAASVVAAVIYYISNIRYSNSMRKTEIETRQANLLVQFMLPFF